MKACDDSFLLKVAMIGVFYEPSRPLVVMMTLWDVRYFYCVVLSSVGFPRLCGDTRLLLFLMLLAAERDLLLESVGLHAAVFNISSLRRFIFLLIIPSIPFGWCINMGCCAAMF